MINAVSENFKNSSGARVREKLESLSAHKSIYQKMARPDPLKMLNDLIKEQIKHMMLKAQGNKMTPYEKMLMKAKFKQCQHVLALSKGKFKDQKIDRLPYHQITSQLEPIWEAHKLKIQVNEMIRNDECKADSTQILMNQNVGNKNVMECLCGSELDQVYFTRKSNCLFSQLMISEFCQTFFSILGILLNIIIQET